MDDQPGPIGRRHSWTGGDADQSVAIRTPGTMASRWGPRKPGQPAPVSAAAGVAGSFAGGAGSFAGAVGSAAGAVGSAGGAVGSAAGSSFAWARSRCSAVFDQRHARSEPAPLTPFVRRRVHTPHASRMVATIVARRGLSERRRLASAQTPRARLTTGMA